MGSFSDSRSRIICGQFWGLFAILQTTSILGEKLIPGKMFTSSLYLLPLLMRQRILFKPPLRGHLSTLKTPATNRKGHKEEYFACAVTARLQRENASFLVLQRKYTSDHEISSLFLNLDMTTLGGFTYICQVSDLE